MRTVSRSILCTLAALSACSAEVEPLLTAPVDGGGARADDAGAASDATAVDADAPAGASDAGVAPLFDDLDLGDAREAQVVGFSPDGRYLAYVIELDVLRGELRAVDLGTGEVRTLDTHVIAEMPASPEALSPLGDGVLYRRNEGPRGVGPWLPGSDLYFVRWDGTRQRIGTDTQRNGFRFASGGQQVLHIDGPSRTLGLFDRERGTDTLLETGVEYQVHAPIAHSLALVDEGRAVAFGVRGDVHVHDLASGALRPEATVSSGAPDQVHIDGGVLRAIVRAADGMAVLRRELASGVEVLSRGGERALLADDRTWALLLGLRDADQVHPLALYDVEAARTVELGAVTSPELRMGPDGDALVLDGSIPAARRLSRVDRASARLEVIEARVYGLGGLDAVAHDGARLVYAESGAEIPEVGPLVLVDVLSRQRSTLSDRAASTGRVLPGSVSFVDRGRSLLWREDGGESPLVLHHLASGASTALGPGGIVDLPGGTRAVLLRSGPTPDVQLVRWSDGAQVQLHAGHARVLGATDAFVVLSAQAATSEWRLRVRRL